MDQPVALPSSVAEVESLILALYDGQTSHRAIVNTQDTLQQLQKSPDGWRLAQALLDRPVRTSADDQIKFFGALTIIVKLNTESAALTDENAHDLLQSLVRWLIGSAAEEGAGLSTQKLVHALVTFYLYFSHLWPLCIRHLLLCLRTGGVAPSAEGGPAASVAEIVAGMNWRQLRVALWFTNSLAAEVAKTDMRVAKYLTLHNRLLENATDVAALLLCGLTAASVQGDPNRKTFIQRESISGLQTWTMYAQRLPASNGDGLVEALRALVPPVVACLEDEALCDVAMELLSEVLSNYAGFLTAKHYEIVASVFDSAWGAMRLQQLLGGDFDCEPLQYGLLMLAYGDARVKTLLQGADAQSQKLVGDLARLLTAVGHPVAEDLVFVPALEFWATFVETMLDDMYTSADDDEDGQYAPWVPAARALVLQVVGHCWAKIQYPSIEVFLEWDAADRAGFGDARKDVADLLQTVFAVAGRDLLAQFAELLLRSLEARAWAPLESTVFCLAALADCVSDDAVYDDVLGGIFAAPLFETLALGAAQLPVRLRQTTLSLLERYAEYFERHAAHLPAVLTLLFDAVSTPALAPQASKAIATLCSSCRSLLSHEAPALVRQYELLRANPSMDPLVEERVVHTLAAVVEAVPDTLTLAHLCGQLIAFVEQDVRLCLDDADPAQPQPLFAKARRQCDQQRQQQNQREVTEPTRDELLLQAVLIPFRCLAAVARGMQSVAEHVVDLDESSGPGDVGSAIIVVHGYRYIDAPDSVEPSAATADLQRRVVALLGVLQGLLTRSSEAVEIFCSVLRAGFAEMEPGPFVLPAATVASLLTNDSTKASPYVGTLVHTASAFVSSLVGRRSAAAAMSTRTYGVLTQLVAWVLSLMLAQPAGETDPELVERGIEMVDRVLHKHPPAVLCHDAWALESFFGLTLHALEAGEPLPKAAAAEFWVTFLTCQPEDPSLKGIVNSAMQQMGPGLAKTLMANFGGNASRSQLDKLCEPLKKLLVADARAQGWLERGLLASSFPSTRVTDADKALFLKKLVRLRGTRQTAHAVREFWMACRGMAFTYAS